MGHDSNQGSNAGIGDLTPGATLRSRYVLEEVVGRGGHSLVFRARDLHRVTADEPDGGFVALKVLRPALRHNSRAIERLSREFHQMQRLSHPGIARVFDLDCAGDIWFLTMELIRARTAAEWLRMAPSIGDTVQVIGQCAQALQYAHEIGVVHGDLKPSNILVTSDQQIKLIDFGSVPSPGDRTGHAAATPSYASPQVLAGMRAECRDDVFSLACVSYEVLSEGQRPFGDQSSLEAHRARLCPAAIPGMPVEVFAALVRSLAGDREQRAASTGDLYRDLIGNAAVFNRRARGVARGRTGRVLRHVSLASIGVAAACSLVLLLPTARKIVAGDEQASDDASLSQLTASSQADTELAGRSVSAEIDGTLAAAEATSDDSVIGDSAVVTPRVSGLVTFENAALVASAAQSLIAIPVKRLQSTHGSAAVEWQVEGGGANVDYKSMRSQIVRFNEGEAVRSIFIPLTHSASAIGVHGARGFVVSLRRVGGGVRLGALTRVNVTIVPQPLLSDLSNAVAVSFSER